MAQVEPTRNTGGSVERLANGRPVPQPVLLVPLACVVRALTS